MTKLPLRNIGLWVLRILVAFVFLMAGGNKLVGNPMMVDMFGAIGAGQGFRYLTGAIEVTAAVLILWPRTSLWGALLTLPVLAGAFITQAVVLHGDVIHVIVITLFAGALAWLQARGRDQAGMTGMRRWLS